MNPTKPEIDNAYRLEVVYSDNKPVYVCMGCDDFPVLKLSDKHGGKLPSLIHSQVIDVRIVAWNMTQAEAFKLYADAKSWLDADEKRRERMCQTLAPQLLLHSPCEFSGNWDRQRTRQTL